MTSTVQISLPNFAGYYEEHTTDHICDTMEYHSEAIDWPKTYFNISKGPVMTLYEERFEGSPFGKPEFVELDSPKYYNFRSDQVIASVTVDLMAMFDITLEDEFGHWLEKTYAARSGWIPFFSTEVDQFRRELREEFTEKAGEFSLCLTVIAEYYFRDYDGIGIEEANSEVTDGISKQFVFSYEKEWMQTAVEKLREKYPDESFREIENYVSDFWKPDRDMEANLRDYNAPFLQVTRAYARNAHTTIYHFDGIFERPDRLDGCVVLNQSDEGIVTLAYGSRILHVQSIDFNFRTEEVRIPSEI